MLRRLTCCAALAMIAIPGAASARPSQRIVNGSQVPIGAVPYQVALIDSFDADGPGLLAFCGGSILDASHVVTAAHCVTDEFTGDPVAPSSVDVVAGSADMESETAPRQRVGVSTVLVAPGWSPPSFANDAAVLALATPLTLAAGSKEAVTLDTGDPLLALTVSGFGLTAFSNPAPERFLRSVDLDFVPDGDAACSVAYPLDYDNATMLCATVPGQTKDSCSGDSGGPLIRKAATAPWVLVGLVSFGEQCAAPGFSGVYSELTSGSSLLSFLSGATGPVVDPSATPLLSGTARVGETLTCNHGTWTNGATQFTYEFFATPATALTSFLASNTYLVKITDQNRTIGCTVRATKPGMGTATATTNTLGPVLALPVEPTPPPPPPPPLPPPTDTTAPTTTVVSRKCSKTTCTMIFTAEDPGFSGGLKAVSATTITRYTVSCVKKKRHTRCARSRKGAPVPVAAGGGSYRLRLTRLPQGSTTVVSITAVDNAGNRQSIPTQAQLKTPKPKVKKKKRKR